MASIDATAEREMCTCCGEVKPTTDFRPDPRKLNGLHSWCLDCERTFARERAQRRRERCLWARYTMYGISLQGETG